MEQSKPISISEQIVEIKKLIRTVKLKLVAVTRQPNIEEKAEICNLSEDMMSGNSTTKENIKIKQPIEYNEACLPISVETGIVQPQIESRLERKEQFHIQTPQSKEVSCDTAAKVTSAQVENKETGIPERSNKTNISAFSEITQTKKQETDKNAAQISEGTVASQINARGHNEEKNYDCNYMNLQNDDKLNNNQNTKIYNNNLQTLQQQSIYASATSIGTKAKQCVKLTDATQICNLSDEEVSDNSSTAETTKENVKIKQPIENNEARLQTSIETGIVQSQIMEGFGIQGNVSDDVKLLERQLKKTQNSKPKEREIIETSYATDVANNDNINADVDVHKSVLRDTATNETIEDSHYAVGAKPKLVTRKQIVSAGNSAKGKIADPVESLSIQTAGLLNKHNSCEKDRTNQTLEIQQFRPVIKYSKEKDITDHSKPSILSVSSLHYSCSESVKSVVEAEREKCGHPTNGMASDQRSEPINKGVRANETIETEELAQTNVHTTCKLQSTTKNKIKPLLQSKIVKDTYQCNYASQGTQIPCSTQKTSYGSWTPGVTSVTMGNIPNPILLQNQLQNNNIRSVDPCSRMLRNMQPIVVQRSFHPEPVSSTGGMITYCLKCRMKTNTNNSFKTKTVKRQPIMKGNCTVCDSKKCCFLK